MTQFCSIRADICNDDAVMKNFQIQQEHYWDENTPISHLLILLKLIIRTANAIQHHTISRLKATGTDISDIDAAARVAAINVQGVTYEDDFLNKAISLCKPDEKTATKNSTTDVSTDVWLARNENMDLEFHDAKPAWDADREQLVYASIIDEFSGFKFPANMAPHLRMGQSIPVKITVSIPAIVEEDE